MITSILIKKAVSYTHLKEIIEEEQQPKEEEKIIGEQEEFPF